MSREIRTIGGQIIRVEPNAGCAMGMQFGGLSGGLDRDNATALHAALGEALGIGEKPKEIDSRQL